MLSKRHCRASLLLVSCLLCLGCGDQSHLADAVRSNDLSAVKRLLDAGADPNAVTKAKWPIIVEGAYADNTEIVHQLLLHGANVDAKNPNGFTALMESSRRGNSALVKELLARKAGIRDVDSELSWNALILAAQTGSEEIVSLLLASGADVNSTDKAGETALICAADKGHLGVVQRLVAGGASVNYRIPNALARSAASEAISADSNGAAILHVLLDAGADVETESWMGETLLVEAARGGHRDAALLLLSRGADPNKVGGFYQKSPLMWAASHNDGELIKALLKAGAFVNATVADKPICATCEALSENALDALHLLLSAGADPDFINPEDHENLLMRAAKAGNIQAIQMLLRAGAKTSVVNSDGKTAADLAREAGSTAAEAELSEVHTK